MAALQQTQAAIQEAAEYIRTRISLRPRVGLILGSGLGDLADSFSPSSVLNTSDIPNYPRPTVEGHKGTLVFASQRGVPILAFKGRLHFYESGDIETVLFPIFLASELGIRTLIVTNAAGGVNTRYTPGDLMLITDHLNLTGASVPGIRSQRNRISSIYDNELCKITSELAEKLNIQLWQGVYAGVKGPSYETAAEVKMVQRAGGDAVGMSTVLETTLASTLGLRVIGITCITNKATGTAAGRLSHDEVTRAAATAKSAFTRLVLSLVEGL